MMRTMEPGCCPRCHKVVPAADAAFCAYCGAPLHAQTDEYSPELRVLLERIDRQNDPAKKHRMLLEAQQVYPDCLPVEEELLFLGRLYERSPKKLDFSIIKCHLWHMYLTPDAFSETQKQQMRQELIAHPQLLRCMSLSDQPQNYLRRYLQRLGGEFVNIFLKGSSHYSRAFMGLRLDNRMDRVLADPVADMLRNIHRDTALSDEHRDMMYDALYRAFLTETGGNARWVDAELDRRGCPIPVKL